MITSLTPPQSQHLAPRQTMRPVNLRTDLAQLADLIEMVFADSMDYGGRAAIREMRAMSHMGVGLSVISHLNELAMGVNLGYVWVDGQRVVGNVSVFPAQWHASLGTAWIIANVAVHPDYRRQGIARRLMRASLDLVRQREGKHAILQVAYDNQHAIELYESMGFVRERAFTTWMRDSRTPPPRVDALTDVFITRRRRSEWQTEHQLVSRLRPFEQGGIGWLKPTHESLFRRTTLQRLMNWFSLSTLERLVVHTPDKKDIIASLWVDNSVGSMRVNLHLFAPPQAVEVQANALLHNALRRFRTANIVLEHPADDEPANALLHSLRFQKHRTVWHMRLTF